MENEEPGFGYFKKNLSKSVMITFAMTGPFRFEIDTGNHGNRVIAGSKNNPQVLLVAGITLHSIFFTAFLPIQFAFPVVDGSCFEYFRDLLPGNMPAVHTALGVLTVFKVRGMTVETRLAGSIIAVGFLVPDSCCTGMNGTGICLPPA